MLMGLNISLCNGGGWVSPVVIRWSPWPPRLVEFRDTFVAFQSLARRGGPGGPGRASSVAEGRERVLFGTRKSFVDQLFAFFTFSESKFEQQLRK